IKWSVLNSGNIVAEGTCSDYLYIGGSPDTVVRRIGAMILNIRDIKGSGGTVTRGVGRFDCSAGTRYEIRAEVGTTIEKLNVTNPVFGARINRQFPTRHFLKTFPIAISGVVVLGLSMLTFLGWALTMLLKKAHT
ncbi:MAG: hypothetical protein O7E52_28445, partial [Candidatus Poribacteria bacterium]|nr:hypothetical protein [Candidatus Poribacteria bacterium]